MRQYGYRISGIIRGPKAQVVIISRANCHWLEVQSQGTVKRLEYFGFWGAVKALEFAGFAPKYNHWANPCLSTNILDSAMDTERAA